MKTGDKKNIRRLSKWKIKSHQECVELNNNYNFFLHQSDG